MDNSYKRYLRVVRYIVVNVVTMGTSIFGISALWYTKLPRILWFILVLIYLSQVGLVLRYIYETLLIRKYERVLKGFNYEKHI